MTDIEKQLAKANGTLDALYVDRIVELIRTRYSQNSEFAILRQRDEKPIEFAEYNRFVEECKAQAKREVYDE